MFNILKKLEDKIFNLLQEIHFTNNFNRSELRHNYKSFIDKPENLALITENICNGSFSGQYFNLNEEDKKFVGHLKESLLFMKRLKKEEQNNKSYYNKGAMWTRIESNFLNNVIDCDDRLFNHIGSLSYKSFKPVNYNFKNSLHDVYLTLIYYDFLKRENKNLSSIYTNLNSPYFTFDKLKLNTNIYYIGIFNIIEKIINDMQKENNKNIKILEIGPGKGQFANIIFNNIKNVKYVMVDIPPMHSIAPYFLYKHGKKICTYKHFCSLNKSLDEVFKNYDVLLLPPYEKEILINYNFDLSINCRSLCEMQFDEAKSYINLINDTSKYFFSVNTNKKSQSVEYEKFGFLDLEKYLTKMNIVDAGFTFGDAAMLKRPHFIYSIYKK